MAKKQTPKKVGKVAKAAKPSTVLVSRDTAQAILKGLIATTRSKIRLTRLKACLTEIKQTKEVAFKTTRVGILLTAFADANKGRAITADIFRDLLYTRFITSGITVSATQRLLDGLWYFEVGDIGRFNYRKTK